MSDEPSKLRKVEPPWIGRLSRMGVTAGGDAGSRADVRWRAEGEVITGPQIRAARKLLGWTRGKLAEHTGTVLVNAIRKCEEGHAIALTSEQLAHVKIALESAGVEFTNVDEPGVKLSASGKPGK